MLEPARYACNDWVIAPVALAVNEAPPASISEQHFQLVLTGVAVFTFQGEPDASGWWRKNNLHIAPPLDPALSFAVDRFGIPAPAGEAGYQYTRHFQVDQLASFVGIASIEGVPDDLAHVVGFACDAWRPHQFDEMTDAFTRATLPRLFTGVDIDLAVWRGDQKMHRVNYQVTLIGMIKFAAVIIT